jgi:hypothetical protein
MPTRPPSPDPTGATSGDAGNPFATLGAGLGAGLDFFQDWIKAAGSALPNLQGATGGGTPGMPAWTMPTLDPAELEKRIQDLKTVQFWLEQNARMIAMTIQGLEVQRMTLSTLKGMNVSMDALRESLKARSSEPPPPPPSAGYHSAFHTPPADSAPPQASANVGAANSDDSPPPGAGGKPDNAAGEGAELINPMRWWDTLTQQFTHLASQAAQTVGDSVGESMDIINKQAAGFSAQARPPARKAPAPRKAAPTREKGGAGDKAGSAASSAPTASAAQAKPPRGGGKPAKT